MATTTTTKPATASKSASGVSTPKAEKKAAAAKPAAPSKKSRAIPLIAAGIAAKTARKDTVAQLVAALGMTPKGAGTYYQNVKSGKWAPAQ